MSEQCKSTERSDWIESCYKNGDILSLLQDNEIGRLLYDDAAKEAIISLIERGYTLPTIKGFLYTLILLKYKDKK